MKIGVTAKPAKFRQYRKYCKIQRFSARSITFFALLQSLLILSACTHNKAKIKAVTPIQQNGVVLTKAPLSDLLAQRRYLCDKKRERREKKLRDFREKYITLSLQDKAKQDASIAEKLEALLIASCDPAKSPGILHETLIKVLSVGKWPDEYADFFDVLVSQQRSYAMVEKQFYDMRFKWQALELEYSDLKIEHSNTVRDLEALEKQHEKTIRGLSEIEAEIDSIEGIGRIEDDNELNIE